MPTNTEPEQQMPMTDVTEQIVTQQPVSQAHLPVVVP